MRLALKFAVVLVLLGVAASPVIAVAHCIALRNVRGSGSAMWLTLGYATHDDCGFHENAANANLGSDNKMSVISVVGPPSFLQVSIAPVPVALPFAVLAPELFQGAPTRTLSSVLRI